MTSIICIYIQSYFLACLRCIQLHIIFEFFEKERQKAITFALALHSFFSHYFQKIKKILKSCVFKNHLEKFHYFHLKGKRKKDNC